jgi:hypothetical protein
LKPSIGGRRPILASGPRFTVGSRLCAIIDGEFPPRGSHFPLDRAAPFNLGLGGEFPRLEYSAGGAVAGRSSVTVGRLEVADEL